MAKQLALGISLRDDATFANFYAPNNLQIIASLNALVQIQNPTESFIYLWGIPGSGRSHLLQASCHAFNQAQQSTAYLPLRDNPHLTPQVLEDLEHMNLICIDDIEVVLGNLVWEEALLHFYNRVREQGTRLIISGNNLPTQLPGLLADLKSRLGWGLVYQVKELDEVQIIEALQMRAANRGLKLPKEVAEYLLKHYPRNMAVLCDMLVQLDQASLIAKRRLTIPFVKQVIANASY